MRNSIWFSIGIIFHAVFWDGKKHGVLQHQYERRDL